MDDLGFTERWLVVDIRASDGLDTWDGVEQICDPARAATFMHVTGDWYRWEFQLRDGEDEADLITPAALGRLLRPVDRAQRPGRPADHPQRDLHLPRPDGIPLPQPGGSSCSATPPTSPRRSSARAWRPGCATPTTWPGSSRTCSPAGPGKTCSTRYDSRTPPARHSPGEKGRPGRLGDDRRAGPRRRRPPDRPGRRGPQRPHLPGHGLHRHPAPRGRRPAAIPAALPPVRHSPRAAGRRPDPQPAGVRRRRHAGPAGTPSWPDAPPC